MTDLPQNDTPSGGELERQSPPDVPLWVKVFVAGAILLAISFVGMHLTGHSMGGH